MNRDKHINVSNIVRGGKPSFNYLHLGKFSHDRYKRDLDFSVKRNRILLIILALFVLFIGFCSLLVK